jgi:hypothetical protein
MEINMQDRNSRCVRLLARTAALVGGLLAASSSPSPAAATATAQLTLVDRYGAVLGNGTQVTEYVGIRLRDGEILGFSQSGLNLVLGVCMDLKVTLPGSTTPIDVTTDPNTTFYTVPARALLFGNCFPFGSLSDAGTTFTLYGRYAYTDPMGNPATVTGQASLTLAIFRAPGFYDAGPAQDQLVQEFGSFADQVEAWLSAAAASRTGAAPVLAEIKEIHQFLQVWWALPIEGQVNPLGGNLQSLGAPAALLIQLSRITVDMSQAGLLELVILPGGGAELSFGVNAVGGYFPPWLPPPPTLFGSAPVTTVYWFNLGF